MTSLVGASVLLIAASALALVFGWVTANESLIWTSIGASVASGVALALAYGRARTEEAPRVPGPSGAAPVASQEAEAISPSEEPQERASEEPDEPASDHVVGVRHSKRFHKPTCRYAAAKNAEPMTKDEAVARGYHACAICSP